MAGPFGAGFFLQVTEQSEGHGKEEGGGGGVGDPHRGEGRGAEEADAGEMKAPSRKAENGVGQPAVESLAGEGGRDSEAAHEEEDEMMANMKQDTQRMKPNNMPQSLLSQMGEFSGEVA